MPWWCWVLLCIGAVLAAWALEQEPDDDREGPI